MDLKSMGRDSRNWPANASSFMRHSWRTEGGEEEEDEAQKEVRQVASSERRRGRLGDVAGRKNGIALHDGNAQRWELRETSASSIPHPVRHREKGG